MCRGLTTMIDLTGDTAPRDLERSIRGYPVVRAQCRSSILRQSERSTRAPSGLNRPSRWITDPKLSCTQRHGKTLTDCLRAQNALEAASSVIILWSTEGVRSQWLLAEAQWALDRGLLMTALLEPVSPPPGFRSAPTSDLSDWDGRHGHPEVNRLFQSMATIMEMPSLPERIPVQPVTNADGSQTPVSEGGFRGLFESWRLVAAFLAGVFVTLLIVLLLFR